MFSHALKLAVRRTLAAKGYSFINVAGMAIGLACCIVIMFWVLGEFSYDRFHTYADRIYRLGISLQIGSTDVVAPRSCLPAAPLIVRELPEVEDAVRLVPLERTTVSVGDQKFIEPRSFLVDSTVFNVFSFPLLQGDSSTVLARPYSLVLTESTARKFFGQTNPIGQRLTVEGEDINDEFTVTGVMSDPPPNSHFTFSMLGSISSLYDKYGSEVDVWFGFNFFSYLLLSEDVDVDQLAAGINDATHEFLRGPISKNGGQAEWFLQPLKDIHLRSHYTGEIGVNGSIEHVYIFGVVAFLILLIAGMNFVNLMTARATTRAKEVGLQKTFGAERLRLAGQFLIESALLCLFALSIALVISELARPFVFLFTGSPLQISQSDRMWVMLGSPALAVLVGLAAGAYPALYLTRFQPAAAMRSGGPSIGGRTRARNVLVVAQFGIAIALVIGTLTAYNQVSYMTDKELGFQKEQVLVLSDVPSLTPSRMATIREALLSTQGVESVAFSTSAPGQQTSYESYLPEGFAEGESLLIHGMQIDPDFVNTLGLEIVAGRNFSFDRPTDPDQAFLITEMAAREFGWDEAVGKRLKHRILTDEGLAWEEKTVIGVVKDFHYASLHYPLEPLILEYQNTRMDMCSMKLAAGNLGATINRVKESWLEVMPDRPFDFFFLDESITSQYASERRLSTILMALTVLAVLTGCLGLVGLVTFITDLRTKEIGIRKVLGASVAGVVRLLTWKFMLLILIANGIAWPAALGVMNWWLSNFAYHIDLNWYVFVCSGAVALGLGLLSVGYRAIRAALASPIRAIRYE